MAFLPTAAYIVSERSGSSGGNSNDGYQLSCFTLENTKKVYLSDGKTAVDYWLRSTRNESGETYDYITTEGKKTTVYYYFYGEDPNKYLRFMINM